MKHLFLIIILLSFSSAVLAKKKRNFLLRYIDHGQRFISNQWSDLNYDLDVYFSNKKYNKIDNRSKIVASTDFFWKEGNKIINYVDFKISVHLPKVSGRLKFVFEKEKDEILESRTNSATKRQIDKQGGATARISYLIHQSSFWQTSFDTGLKLNLPLNPFGKFQIFSRTETKLIDIYLGQKFIFYRHERFSEITQLSFSKKISAKFEFIQDNTVTWTENENYFILRNSLTLTHRLNYKSSLKYIIGANAEFSPVFEYFRYDASISFYRLLHKKWFYGNISFGAELPRNGKPQPFALLRFEAFFH